MRSPVPIVAWCRIGRRTWWDDVVRIVVLCPHFAPDTAPTGTVMSRLVAEWAARGHRIDVVTALPWYRDHSVADGWQHRLSRTEHVEWGSVTRLHPFPGGDRRDLARRAAGFVGFSALSLFGGVKAGGLLRRADAVVAMSPPLTLGLTGRLVAWSHRAPFVFNVQDVFPDAAERTGAITDRRVLAVARWLERWSYRVADAVTVLSSDLGENVAAKMPPRRRGDVRVISNFVDTDRIRPASRATAYRRELGLGDETVVMYAGNVGFSQSLHLLLDAARARPELTFVVNGGGSALSELRRQADDLRNVIFAPFAPQDRLGEVLASADVHVVPLRAGLGAVSVPSKAYSILAAARPVVAAIDADTEIPRILASADAGVTVAPDDADAFVAALDLVLEDPRRAEEMGARGRAWVMATASPAAAAESYLELFAELGRNERRPAGATRR